MEKGNYTLDKCSMYFYFMFYSMKKIAVNFKWLKTGL